MPSPHAIPREPDARQAAQQEDREADIGIGAEEKLVHRIEHRRDSEKGIHAVPFKTDGATARTAP